MLQDLLTDYLKTQCANGQLQKYIRQRLPVAGELLAMEPFEKNFRSHVDQCRVQLRLIDSNAIGFAHQFDGPIPTETTPQGLFGFGT